MFIMEQTNRPVYGREKKLSHNAEPPAQWKRHDCKRRMAKSNIYLSADTMWYCRIYLRLFTAIILIAYLNKKGNEHLLTYLLAFY